jgi:hypothetical protein
MAVDHLLCEFGGKGKVSKCSKYLLVGRYLRVFEQVLEDVQENVAAVELAKRLLDFLVRVGKVGHEAGP